MDTNQIKAPSQWRQVHRDRFFKVFRSSLTVQVQSPLELLLACKNLEMHEEARPCRAVCVISSILFCTLRGASEGLQGLVWYVIDGYNVLTVWLKHFAQVAGLLDWDIDLIFVTLQSWKKHVCISLFMWGAWAVSNFSYLHTFLTFYWGIWYMTLCISDKFNRG